MKRILSVILALVLLLSSAITVSATDTSRAYFFELAVDGTNEKRVHPGEIITVVFTLSRTDSEESYDMYAMQNEIRYDSEFFRLVEDSTMLTSGISTAEIGLRDSFREFYMNFVSLSGGDSWKAKRLIGSFQLEVIGNSGVTKITNQDYLVSTADGKDSYAAQCQDVTIILTTDCTVTFETNGGSVIPEQIVQYGETVTRPADPVRDGYRLVGWYTDIDLQKPWEFDVNTVQGNVTLYAKWEKATSVDDPIVEPTEPGEDGFAGLWWLLGFGLCLIGLLILLLVLLLGKKTVTFETGCKMRTKTQRIKKGGHVQRPAEPVRLGRTFAGWFCDAACTNRWDFENDKVEENMTLYAKWI